MTYAEARARAIVFHRHTVEHEAAHGAAALCLGLNVTEIRVDRPDAVTAGRIRVKGAPPRDLALTVLAAPLLDETVPTPGWPLVDYEGATHDERRLIEAIEELDLDRAGWDALVRDCWDLVCTDAFHLRSMVIEAFLAEWPVIEGDRLAAVLDCVRTNEKGRELTYVA